jgi:hypothetical protein
LTHYGVAAGQSTNFRDEAAKAAADAKARSKADELAKELASSDASEMPASAKSKADESADVAVSDAADEALKPAESQDLPASLSDAKTKMAQKVAVPAPRRRTRSWASEAQHAADMAALSDIVSSIGFRSEYSDDAPVEGMEASTEDPSGGQSATTPGDAEMTDDAQEPSSNTAQTAAPEASSTAAQQPSASSNADKTSKLDEPKDESRCEECQAVGLSGRHRGRCDPERRQESLRLVADREAKKAEKAAAHEARQATAAQQKAEKTRLKQEAHQRQQAEAKAKKAGKRPQRAADTEASTADASNATSAGSDTAMGDAPSVPRNEDAAQPKGGRRFASSRKASSHQESSRRAPLCPGCHDHHFGSCNRQLAKAAFEEREKRLLDGAAAAKTKHEFDSWQRRYQEFLESQAVEKSNAGGKRRARSPPSKERPAKRRDDEERPGV